ncbi:hypothetical protein CYMTET_26885, partial [Cymbomonas tetramitiformis]
VASIRYARIQGSAALIQHFQNSSLLHEDKRCRPVLFSATGQPEPFPVAQLGSASGSGEESEGSGSGEESSSSSSEGPCATGSPPTSSHAAPPSSAQPQPGAGRAGLAAAAVQCSA